MDVESGNHAALLTEVHCMQVAANYIQQCSSSAARRLSMQGLRGGLVSHDPLAEQLQVGCSHLTPQRHGTLALDAMDAVAKLSFASSQYTSPGTPGHVQSPIQYHRPIYSSDAGAASAPQMLNSGSNRLYHGDGDSTAAFDHRSPRLSDGTRISRPAMMDAVTPPRRLSLHSVTDNGRASSSSLGLSAGRYPAKVVSTPRVSANASPQSEWPQYRGPGLVLSGALEEADLDVSSMHISPDKRPCKAAGSFGFR